VPQVVGPDPRGQASAVDDQGSGAAFDLGCTFFDTAGVMGELIETGKILGWGQSQATEAQIRAAHAITPSVREDHGRGHLHRFQDRAGSNGSKRISGQPRSNSPTTNHGLETELAKLELHGNRTDEDIAKLRDLD
jgi:hypothetical protein